MILKWFRKKEPWVTSNDYLPTDKFYNVKLIKRKLEK